MLRRMAAAALSLNIEVSLLLVLSTSLPSLSLSLGMVGSISRLRLRLRSVRPSSPFMLWKVGEVSEDIADDPSDADSGADIAEMMDVEERMVEASPLMLAMASLELLPSLIAVPCSSADECARSARSFFSSSCSSLALALAMTSSSFMESAPPTLLGQCTFEENASVAAFPTPSIGFGLVVERVLVPGGVASVFISAKCRLSQLLPLLPLLPLLVLLIVEAAAPVMS